MKQREFEIQIGPDGTVELLVKGYKGKKCLEAVKAFETLIGPVQKLNETAEFYEPEEEVHFRIDQRSGE